MAIAILLAKAHSLEVIVGSSVRYKTRKGSWRISIEAVPNPQLVPTVRSRKSKQNVGKGSRQIGSVPLVEGLALMGELVGQQVVAGCRARFV